MKHFTPLLFLCCFVFFQSATAQNLVPNTSFEDTVHMNGGPVAKQWNNNIGSPDYLTAFYGQALAGFRTPVNVRGAEVPYEGGAYFGFAVLDQRRNSFREYMQTELLDTLVANLQYEVEFFISLADSFHLALAANDIGIHFNNAVYPNNYDHQVREFRPYYTSDTVWDAANKNGWERFHYTYTAHGGENTLVIGCFLNDQEITVDSVGNGGDFPWAYKGSYYFIDNLSVTLKDSSTSMNEYNLVNQIRCYPNPAKNDLFLEYVGEEKLIFQLYNVPGQPIETLINENRNKYHLSLQNLTAGIYLLKVSDGKSQKTYKILKQ